MRSTGISRSRSRSACAGAAAHRPSNAPKPAPKPRLRRAHVVRSGRLEHLARECDVGLRAAALRIEKNDRFAVRRRFGNAHVARNLRLENLFRKELDEFVEHFDRESRAAVEHRDEHAAHVQCRIERFAYARNDAGQLRQAFERVVFGLHRNDALVCGGQRVDREQAERRRTIDQHEIVAIGDRRERLAAAAFRATSPRRVRFRRRRDRSSRARATGLPPRLVLTTSSIAASCEQHVDRRRASSCVFDTRDRSWRCLADRRR